MPEAKQQEPQSFTRPALKPFVKPLVDEPRPSLRPAAPAFGRVTLPPFGPIRYGGPKPGTAISTPAREDDEAPTWASIEEYVHQAPPTEVPEPEPEALEPEPEPVAAAPELPYVAAEPEPETAVAPAAVTEVEHVEQVQQVEQRDEPMPWEALAHHATPEPEPMTRRPVLPLTGPNDPTPVMNTAIERTIERTTERTTERSTEPHRMTPMRVTPLRPSAIPATTIPSDPNARAIAAALEMVAGRVRRGDLIVSGSMPSNDDPPALAAVLAATAAALLGVRS